MTTATPTAAAPTTLVEVRTADGDRLSAAVKAADTRLKELQAAHTAAQTLLTAAAADVAMVDQEVSRLRQQLAAATTGPERHRIELALDAAAVRRLRALRRQVDATVAVAAGQASITRLAATASRLAGELTTAQAALAKATADEIDVAASRKDLATTIGQVTAEVTALAPRVQEATDRLDVLLGSAAMRAGLADRLGAVATQDAGRRAALVAAEDEVLAADRARSAVDGGLAVAAAEHLRALAAVRAAATAPARLVAATAAVDAVRILPDLPEAEQDAITRAATGTDDPTVIPVQPTATPLENWAIKIPAAVREPALALVDAQAVLVELAALDATALLDRLDRAQTAYVAALVAQLAAAQARAAAGEAAKAAADEATAHEASAADRRALAVSGD